MAVARIAAWRGVVDLTAVKLEEGSDGFTRSWIMLVPEGKFDHPQWGEIDLTKPVLDKMVRNFHDHARGIDIALDYDHKASEGDSRAPGWIENIEYRPKSASAPAGLWARVRWTPIGLADVKNQIYRYVSAEFKGDYKDVVTGKTYKHVILGATLTNRPFMKQMPAIQLSEVSRKPWSSVNKSKLPDSAFLDPKNRRLPVYEGTGPLDANGRYTQRGALNINGVKAALGAIHGARSGKAMTGLPAGLVARLEGWLKRYSGEGGGDESAAASEGAGAVAGRKQSRKLADPEPEAEDEQEQVLDETETEEENEDEDALDVLGEDGADEEDDSDDAEELDEGESDDEDSETEQLAEKKPFKGAAKPFGKGGKKPTGKADNEPDGDEEMADDTDMEYDEADGDGPDNEPDGDEEMPMPKGKKSAGKGKGMPVKKMSETQMLSEITRLREENKQLREEQFKLSVSKKLSEFTREIRADGDDEQFALPRSFKLAYRDFMFEHGIRLSEGQRDGLDELVKLALRVGTVPLTSLANQVESGKVRDLDDRRPRVVRSDEERTEAAKKIALSEFKKPLDELDLDTRMSIFFRLEEGRNGSGKGHNAA